VAYTITTMEPGMGRPNITRIGWFARHPTPQGHSSDGSDASAPHGNDDDRERAGRARDQQKGWAMAEKQLVLSFFGDEALADAAAAALKDSGQASGDAIGILVLDDAGNLKVDKAGARSWGAGAGIGACLFVLGPAALGVGLIGGTAAGGLHHKGLKLSDEDKERIAGDLGAGKAAVGVLARMGEGDAIRDALTASGGTTSSHDVVDEAALQAAAAG